MCRKNNVYFVNLQTFLHIFSLIRTSDTKDILTLFVLLNKEILAILTIFAIQNLPTDLFDKNIKMYLLIFIIYTHAKKEF